MQKHSSAIPPSLDDVQRRFAAWRRSRKSRTRIPAELWKAAASLSPQHSTHKISKALGLNHTDLKKRIEAGAMLPNIAGVPSSTFVEFSMPPVPAVSQCTIEMQNRQGEKLRMMFSGEINLDLLELSRSFWGTRP